MTFDKKIKNLLLFWLSSSLFLILLMIIVGGLTRLTNSGLSITEWELFSGILPPLSKASWNTYFDLYKQIPQFKLINPLMNLNEFKVIFYWEYAHRVLGRIIGLFFLIPLLYFHFIKKIKFSKLIPYYTVLLLIIIQGIIGWYMVKSGLVSNTSVSHYRLSLHLGTAIIILCMIFWQFLKILNNKSYKFFNFDKTNIPYFFLIMLIFIQIVIGAFVSGLDAGKIYQSWPLMGQNYIPDDLSFNKFEDYVDFDNHSLVQFYHRNFAYLILIYILILSFSILKRGDKNKIKAVIILLLVLSLQIILGIFTLLSDLHITLALGHQIIGIILILSTINLYFSVNK